MSNFLLILLLVYLPESLPSIGRVFGHSSNRTQKNQPLSPGHSYHLCLLDQFLSTLCHPPRPGRQLIFLFFSSISCYTYFNNTQRREVCL